MPHKLLLPKTAMDAVNEQLLDPSDWHYPGVDKEYYSPFFYKGTESKDEQIERRSSVRKAATYTCSDCGHKQRNNVSCEKCGSACSFKKSAEISQHEEPRILPPRDELRSHLDDEVKKDLALEKEGAIRLTTAQDRFWSGAFEKFSRPRFQMHAAKALRMADRETIRQWPELAKYSSWLDPIR